MKIHEVRFPYNWLEFKAKDVDLENDGVAFEHLYVRDHDAAFRRVPDSLADLLINTQKFYKELHKACLRALGKRDLGERCPRCGDPDPETCGCSMDF